MDYRLAAALAGGLLFAAPIGAGHAQPACDASLSALPVAERGSAGQPAFMGLTGTGNLLEVRLSGEGAWTIVLTQKDGATCAVATGNFWETVDPDLSLLVPGSRGSHKRID